jgi:hypothetical protein
MMKIRALMTVMMIFVGIAIDEQQSVESSRLSSFVLLKEDSNISEERIALIFDSQKCLMYHYAVNY